MFLGVILSLFLLIACGAKTQSLKAFYTDEQIENVDKIILTDGSTGSSKTISKPQQISELLGLIRDIEFSPQDNQEKREGWRYSIALYDGDKEFKFTLDKIGKTYYDTEPEIYPIIDDYYKKLEIKEK